MKNTLATLALFVFLTLIFSDKLLAYLPPIDDIRDSVQIKIPTATPTPVIFKKIDPNINLQLVVTIAPAAKLTVTPEPTLGTKLTVTPEPTLGTKLTVTPEETEISPTINQNSAIEPEVATGEGEVKGENTVDLKTWFMGITIGLLALIIVIQLWPKKKIV